MNEKPFLTFRVAREDDGKRLRSILLTRFQFSRATIRRLKQDDCVLNNGRSVKIVDPVSAGDTIAIFYPADWESIVIPERMKLNIMYEDEDVIIVNKPAGVLVHPSGRTLTGTVANGVAAHQKDRGEKNRTGPVTRLDRHTTGLVLFAKHPHAHHVLSQAIITEDLKREYTAIVQGRPEHCRGTINTPIRRVEGSVTAREVAEDGQRAVTHYEVLRHLHSDRTLIRVKLETGRTHQIRVHLSSIGLPLIGDEQYGIVIPGVMERQALHATRLTLPHPLSREMLDVTSPLPADMKRLL